MSKNALVEIDDPAMAKELAALGKEGRSRKEDHKHNHDHDSHGHDDECGGTEPEGGETCSLDSVGACSCHKQKGEHAHGHDHAHGHSHGEEAFSWKWRIIAPGVLFALGLLGRGWLTATFGNAGFLAVMLLAYALCGLPVLREAAGAVRRKDFFNEFTLMGVASLVALAIGESAEAVGVMLFYSLGEAVQEMAAGKSRRSIKSLLASKPEAANVVRDGRVEVVRPEKVAVGSRILVKPGEKVPLDGVVTGGGASLDMSSITGESAPVSVEKGGKVYSGAICLDGDLVVETTAGYKDSMVGKILAMVENAVAMKSRTERFITVFARYYTPIVTGAAVLVATIPPLLFAQSWNVWIYRALVLLVVSCPCALLLSVPLAFFAGIGTASRHGMLVKGGQVFDALAKVRDVVFDKTGTLTEGRLSLSGVEPADGATPEETLRLAAIAESRSNHPVARAVLAALENGDSLPEDVTTKNIAGRGIAAHTAEGEILVGNARLMADHNVEFAENASEGAVAYVALNGVYKGCLTFSDQLKKDAVSALADLRQSGRKLYMLTGDRPEAAAAVAAQIGLDGYRAGLLPDEKVAAFRELSPTGSAAFVGDGVNDAPVLASSGVGVAMGALGSAAAVEAADAVILDDSPARLPQLFRIASRTRRIAGENIAFALLVKAAIMVIGVLGYTGLWAAVFADVGVALIAVANSMRLTRD